MRAAEAGRVIYSGRLSDYGRVVILKHTGRYSSVYAHNHKNRVTKGQFVEKGDTIASVEYSDTRKFPVVTTSTRKQKPMPTPKPIGSCS